MQSTRYSCQILMVLASYRQIFEKKSWNIKFHENPSNGNRFIPCGQTDGTDTAKPIVTFWQFCEKAKKKLLP